MPEEPKSDSKLTFSIPEGFDTEGKEEGETIEFVGEARIEKGGKLCLKKINGIEVPGYAKETKPDTGDFAEAVTGEPADYS